MWSESIEILDPYAAISAKVRSDNIDNKRKKITFWQRISRFLKKGR